MTFTQYMLENLQKIISRNREYFFKISEQADKIIVWLVGFSIASIALSISNSKLLIEISDLLPSVIIIFSSLTIIFGVLYRTFIYIAQTLENKMLISFEGYVEGCRNPPDIELPREIIDNESIDNLVSFLHEDFKVEIGEINKDNLSQEQLSKIQKDLVKYYRTLSEISVKQLESQVENIKEVLKSYLGYSEKRANRIFNPVKPKLNLNKICWFSIYFAFILFILTTLTFISGFTTFMGIYIMKTICS
jgi:hypothetical protein